MSYFPRYKPMHRSPEITSTVKKWANRCRSLRFQVETGRATVDDVLTFRKELAQLDKQTVLGIAKALSIGVAIRTADMAAHSITLRMESEARDHVS